MYLNWNFQRGVGEGGVQTEKLSVGGYGYFLEQHNLMSESKVAQHSSQNTSAWA